MTYSTGGLIQASDFNNIVGSPSSPNTGRTLNAIWGTGFSNKGYGQSQLANVNENELISSENWSTLIKTINTNTNIIKHLSNTNMSTFVIFERIPIKKTGTHLSAKCSGIVISCNDLNESSLPQFEIF
mgnify:CR=1 FL=1